MSVVPEEPVSVGRRVEVSLDWPEAPLPGGGRISEIRQIGTVKTRMTLHFAPDAERWSSRDLGKRGSVRPTGEL